MSDRLKALREQRGVIVASMTAMVDTATAAKRDLNAEEVAKHAEMFDKQELLRKNIEAEERNDAIAREAAEAAARNMDPKKKAGDPSSEARALKLSAAFCRFLTGTNAFAGDGAEELRALQADADTAGGFLVAPEQFVNQLLMAVDNQTFVRANATVFQVPSAQSLGVPTLDADPDDADWTSELATGSEDATMAFGKRQLYPRPLAKRIKVSNKLLRLSTMGPEALVMARLAYKFAVSQEKAHLTGTGAGQPLGVFVASNDGIPTSRDVSTGNSTTAITVDGLINAKYSLKSPYWATSRWMFHRDAMKMISKLKDGDGNYLWRPSIREDEPDTLLGRPIDVSEYAPSTFTTGLYVGILADWKNYWIADALDMTIQRLLELYAETNQTGFIGRLETDGMPVLSEAFARVTLG